MIKTTKVPNKKILDLEKERKWLIDSSEKVIRSIELCMSELKYVNLIGLKVGSIKNDNFLELRLKSLKTVKSRVYRISKTQS